MLFGFFILLNFCFPDLFLLCTGLYPGLSLLLLVLSAFFFLVLLFCWLPIFLTHYVTLLLSLPTQLSLFKKLAEDEVQRSGFDYTIVRPSKFAPHYDACVYMLRVPIVQCTLLVVGHESHT